MGRWPRRRIAAIAAAGVLAAWAAAHAETCTLELKRLESPSQVRVLPAGQDLDYLCRYTYPQFFHVQIMPRMEGAVQPGEGTKSFAEIVQKEPKYESEYPFRAVAKLGLQQFAFVLDAKPAQSKAEEAKTEEAKTQRGGLSALVEALRGAATEEPAKSPPKLMRYGRLFFDLNGNGDLTDDRVIEAEQQSGAMYPSGYSSFSFPRVDVSLDVEGTKVEYAFTLSGYANVSENYAYASAQLNAAAYRHGQITLDGKPRHIVLIDFNSNGRFDDPFAARDDVRGSGGEVYPSYGDMILVDPLADYEGYRSPYDVTTSPDRYHVSKLINIDGRYYDLEASPAGDKLTLTPSSAPVGHVTNPNDGFRAVLYGEKGFLKISGGKSKPAAVPEGQWRLLAYTIDRTGYELEPQPGQQPKEQAKETAEERSLLQVLADALVGSQSPASRPQGPRYTLVSAQATADCPPVNVAAGQTVALAFGPPYKPVVKVEYFQGDQAQLGLSLIGAGGERCSNLIVDGSTPPEPEFTITTADGKEVEQGKFRYG